MRYLILSDIHANWHALQAVLEDAQGAYERIICCGDIVGYNAQPTRVLEWAREHCASIVRGNHDKVVAGLEDLEWFSDIAQDAARWTIKQLRQDQLDFLANLKQGPLQLEHFTIWHGSARDEDEYITMPDQALACLPHFNTSLAFFGHTHLQGGFFVKQKRVGLISPTNQAHQRQTIELQPDYIYMINPGAVGQPRDEDPRAAYARFDSERKFVELRRVEYPLEETAAEIKQAGLPDMLALRLFRGI